MIVEIFKDVLVLAYQILLLIIIYQKYYRRDMFLELAIIFLDPPLTTHPPLLNNFKSISYTCTLLNI